MIAEFHFEEGPVKVDIGQGIDLSDPFSDQGDGPLAWGIEHPRYTPVRAGDFVGSVKEGGAVNFRDLFLNPHGNGTHTEGPGHITEKVHSVNGNWSGSFHRALLISIEPAVQKGNEGPRSEGDAVILQEQLEEALEGYVGWATALIVHTHPYPGGRPRDHSGTNPPYFHPEAMSMLREKGIFHLLTDLPSVDKENDGGALPAHHAFWRVPDAPDFDRSITELLKIPPKTSDGPYLLNLQLAPIENDAAPSRPVIFPLLDGSFL